MCVCVLCECEHAVSEVKSEFECDKTEHSDFIALCQFKLKYWTGFFCCCSIEIKSEFLTISLLLLQHNELNN